jgi:cell filamentation protein
VPGYTLDDGVTLKNKLGAISHDALETAESDFVANRLRQFELGHGPSGQVDAAYLKAIHRHLFQDVYEWAGHTRDEKVALSDGTVATEPLLRKVDGSPSMAGPLIPKALARMAGALRKSNPNICAASRARNSPRAQPETPAEALAQAGGLGRAVSPE